MIIRITAEQLRQMEACKPGVEEFETWFGCVLEGDYRPACQAFALATPMRKWLGWAWLHGLIPMFPMRGWDLRGAHLWDVDVWRADLSGARMAGADCRDGHFHGTRFVDADLRGVNMTGAWLRCARFDGANLEGCDMTRCDLRGQDVADLSRRGAIVDQGAA